jgi:hypothetical protein
VTAAIPRAVRDIFGPLVEERPEPEDGLSQDRATNHCDALPPIREKCTYRCTRNIGRLVLTPLPNQLKQRQIALNFARRANFLRLWPRISFRPGTGGFGPGQPCAGCDVILLLHQASHVGERYRLGNSVRWERTVTVIFRLWAEDLQARAERVISSIC